MKWKNRGAARRKRGRSMGLVAMTLWLGLLATPAHAQSTDCGDTLTLYSPESLTVEFDRSGNPGNRLRWPGLSFSEGSCYRLEVAPGLQASLAPSVDGTYLDFFDRRISFAAADSGLVGDTTLDQVRLGVSSFPPNGEVPSFTGTLNLSGRGGIFRGDVSAVSAVQANTGIPAHLPLTDVTAVAAGPAGSGTPRLYAAITGLPIVRSDDGGATWYEPIVALDPAVSVPASQLAVSPSDPDLLFMGTSKEGVYRSDDGGVTWAKTALEISSGNEEITTLKYLEVENASGAMVDRLYLGITGRGFFYSDDDGGSWVSLSSLVLPAIVTNQDTGVRTVRCDILPSVPTQVRVRDVEVSVEDPRRIYVALRDWGVYTTIDHSQWERANLGIVFCGGAQGIDPENSDLPNGRSATVTELFVAPVPSVDGDVLFASTASNGIFISTNGGEDWGQLTQGGFPQVNGSPATVRIMLEDPADPQGVLVGTASRGFVSFRSGSWVTWAPAGLTNPKIAHALRIPGGGAGEILIATSGAGIYRPGVSLDLTRTIAPAPGFEGVDTILGLELTVDGTSMRRGDSFDVLAQTIQAYAVWRALEVDGETGEPQWVMIGLYDLTNPEFCSVDPCDAPNQSQIAGCFANKRANCFGIEVGSERLLWSFFDSDVYNGFTYRYAVSTLDYGYTGDVSPLVFDGDFVFSPRSPMESNPQALPFVDARPENYNWITFQVNLEAQADLSGVYAVPNPLRRQGGWDSGDDSTIRFVRVTDTSKVQVFTLAGDLVRELENVVTDGVERGNIQWDTRNSEGELVASGVYIYRVTDDAGGEFVSRVTIIR